MRTAFAFLLPPVFLALASGASEVATKPAETAAKPAPAVRRAPTPTPDQKWLGSVYQDLLGRAPDSSSLGTFTSMLAKGVPRRDVALGIVRSAECRSHFVQGLYQSLLGRPADGNGLNGFVGLLGAGGTYRQVEAAILSSPEYFQARAAGKNEGFVDALYKDVLGRTPDSAGRSAFLNQLGTGMPRAQVVNAFLGSTEATAALAGKLYHQFLHRDPEPNGLQFFTNAFKQGQHEEDIIATLLSSPEYK